MINSICRRFAVVMLALSAFALSACAGGNTTTMPLGPLASEEEILEMMSGYSFPQGTEDGQIYYAADGTTKSFRLYADGGNVACDGTWRVEGSYIFSRSACHWPDHLDSGNQKNGQPYDYRYQAYLLGSGDEGLVVVELEGPSKKNVVYQLKRIERLEGFPREAEYDEVRRQLGL